MLRLASHRIILPTAAAPGRGAQGVLPAVMGGTRAPCFKYSTAAHTEALEDYRHNLCKITQVVA